MLLKSTRTLSEMSSVLLNKNLSSSDPIYWVFSDVSKTWENMTIVSPGNYDGEFPKTFGHYHTNSNSVEKYKLLSGQGILLMQKRKFIDDDWSPENIEKIYFIEFVPGDEIDISVEWGHSWSNIGSEPLVTLDNWKEGHSPQDYSQIEKLGGMGYFLVNRNGKAEFVPNENYKDLPSPEWISASDFHNFSTTL